MDKRGLAKWAKITLIILISIVIILSVIVITILIVNSKNSTTSQKTTLTNPINNLTDAEAQEKLNKTFVRYLLYTIEADELHRPPLSQDTPKINIYIGNLNFGAEISKGVITVQDNPHSTSDIKIITTREEAIKMLRDASYIASSFSTGTSQIELVASKTKLFAKGYLKLYTELTGEEAAI
ncbi:MAG: hypothetical protein KC506_00755 [Nanoarchaeota archaeon]|nr:hypothetical protein [Nanoarchaeota archaeon]